MRHLIIAPLILAAACTTTSHTEVETKAATDTPEVFLVQQAGILSRVPGTNACLSPLFDPRDHTELKMIRSFGDGLGDYAVPADGKYGVGRGELLRIDCRTGEAVGVVRR